MSDQTQHCQASQSAAGGGHAV